MRGEEVAGGRAGHKGWRHVPATAHDGRPPHTQFVTQPRLLPCPQPVHTLEVTTAGCGSSVKVQRRLGRMQASGGACYQQSHTQTRCRVHTVNFTVHLCLSRQPHLATRCLSPSPRRSQQVSLSGRTSHPSRSLGSSAAPSCGSWWDRQP